MVDTIDLGSITTRCESSSLSLSTTKRVADVIGSIMDSKSIRQGSSPWRRANCPMVELATRLILVQKI